MGLENGVVIKAKEDFKWQSGLVSWTDGLEIPKGKSLEVCYWRRAFGIRDKIMESMMIEKENHKDIVVGLNSYKLRNIVWELSKFIDEEYYNYNANSGWSYSVFVNTLWEQICILVYVESLVNAGLVEVEFYEKW